MPHAEALIAFLEQRMTLTAKDAALVQSLVIPRKAKKGEFLQRAGEVARYGHFVARGCLRSFSIDERGKDHVLQFAPEGWWLTDFTSITAREQRILASPSATAEGRYAGAVPSR